MAGEANVCLDFEEERQAEAVFAAIGPLGVVGIRASLVGTRLVIRGPQEYLATLWEIITEAAETVGAEVNPVDPMDGACWGRVPGEA